MTIDAGSLARLRAAIRGGVLTADEGDYDEARRVWNGMIDKRPLVIVQAAAGTDVGPTVALARETSLPLAIRGGGHNVAGNGTVDDGILLDLGRLNAVEIDPDARLVRVEAGRRSATSIARPRRSPWPCQWASSPAPGSPG